MRSLRDTTYDLTRNLMPYIIIKNKKFYLINKCSNIYILILLIFKNILYLSKNVIFMPYLQRVPGGPATLETLESQRRESFMEGKMNVHTGRP
jgi:hypothetical protein